MNVTTSFTRRMIVAMRFPVVLALVTLHCNAAEIIAHRGASFDAPENTLASVILAWKQNADAVEVDVYLSRDGHIVLMHDKTPKRYGGPDRPVAEMDWAEIQQLDVGAWKHETFRGETVPLLSSVLETIPAGRRLFIEIKSGPEILPELKRVLDEAKRPPEETVIICFSQSVVKGAVKLLPELQTYWLVSTTSNGKPPVSAETVIATARQLGAHGVDVGGNTKLIDKAFMSALNDVQIPCYVWTVNDPSEADRLSKLGVLGITTDRPKLLRSHGIADALEASQ